MFSKGSAPKHILILAPKSTSLSRIPRVNIFNFDTIAPIVIEFIVDNAPNPYATRSILAVDSSSFLNVNVAENSSPNLSSQLAFFAGGDGLLLHSNRIA